VEDNYQLSVKYHTLHKQLHYRMKAKLKVPRRLSNQKYPVAAIELKKNYKNCWKLSSGWSSLPLIQQKMVSNIGVKMKLESA
jgi:hypothetical protein